MKFFKTPILLIFFVLLLPSAAQACECFITSADIAEGASEDREMYNIRHYDVIFWGKLTEIKADNGVMNNKIDFNPRDAKVWHSYGGIKYTFSVSRQWKGPGLGKTATIYQGPSAWLASGCSTRFKLNEEYLIYSSAPQPGGMLDIVPAAYCSPTIGISNLNAFGIQKAKDRVALLNRVEKLGFDQVMIARKKDRDVIRAAAAGDLTSVKSLLEGGAALDVRDESGKTALVAAIDQKHAEIATFLLEKGAKIDDEPNGMRSVLGWAVVRGTKGIVAKLLEMGANINESARDGTALVLAAKEKNEDMVRFLVEHEADVNAADVGDFLDKATALHYAACYKNTKTAELLMSKGADINANDSENKSVIAWAARCGQTQMVRLLLDKGAVIHETAYKRGPAWTSAVEKGGNLETLKMLFEADKTADVNTKLVANRTPLMEAAGSGRLDAVKFLLERGADVNAQDTIWGLTALIAAAQRGDKEIVKLLLSKGANPDLKNKAGATAWDVAKANKFAEVVKILEAVKAAN